MAKQSYASIQKQIEKLQTDAKALRTEEVAGVIARIKEAIASYGLEPQDLFGRSARTAQASTSRNEGSKSPRSTKYADGKGGEWGGRGPRPAWLRKAVADGHTLDEFLVD